jgi:hypothetical protein
LVQTARKVERVIGIEPMLAVWDNARNGRFREAVAAFLRDRSWPVSACQARAAKQPFMNPAQLSDSAAMSPAAAVNVPVAACQSH